MATIDARRDTDNYGTRLDFSTGLANAYGGGDSNTNIRMTINNQGNVGIGTATPTSFTRFSQPAAVATTPGTVATSVLNITGGIGGNTTIATTGVGGIGAALSLTGGAGGTAASAVTASTGGAGGALTLTSGVGERQLSLVE